MGSHTRSTSADALSVVTLLQKTVDTTNRELEAGLSRTRLLALAFSSGGFSRLGLSSSFARHPECLRGGYRSKSREEEIWWWWLLVKNGAGVGAWKYEQVVWFHQLGLFVHALVTCDYIRSSVTSLA